MLRNFLQKKIKEKKELFIIVKRNWKFGKIYCFNFYPKERQCQER